MGAIISALMLINSTLVVVMMIATAPAHAAICGTRGAIVKTLIEKYDEQRLASGLVGTTGVVEIFTSARGTFSIVTTNVRGWSCMITAGEAWSIYPQNHDPES